MFIGVLLVLLGFFGNWFFGLFKKGFDYNLRDGKNSNIDQACKEIKKQKYKTICLNDVNVANFDETKKKINAALDAILPEKSSFEK